MPMTSPTTGHLLVQRLTVPGGMKNQLLFPPTIRFSPVGPVRRVAVEAEVVGLVEVVGGLCRSSVSTGLCSQPFGLDGLCQGLGSLWKTGERVPTCSPIGGWSQPSL